MSRYVELMKLFVEIGYTREEAKAAVLAIMRYEVCEQWEVLKKKRKLH